MQPTKATIKANLAKPKKQPNVYNNSIFMSGNNNKHVTLNNNVVTWIAHFLFLQSIDADTVSFMMARPVVVLVKAWKDH